MADRFNQIRHVARHRDTGADFAGTITCRRTSAPPTTIARQRLGWSRLGPRCCWAGRCWAGSMRSTPGAEAGQHAWGAVAPDGALVGFVSVIGGSICPSPVAHLPAWSSASTSTSMTRGLWLKDAPSPRWWALVIGDTAGAGAVADGRRRPAVVAVDLGGAGRLQPVDGDGGLSDRHRADVQPSSSCWPTRR